MSTKSRYYILTIILLTFAIGCSSCRQVQYVPVETVRTDSIYLTHTQRDSIHLHDSIYVHDAGDTVRIERWRYAYLDRWRVDTMYSERIDTLSVPYPVERSLTRWEQTCLDIGGYAIVAVIVTILIVVGKLVYKLKKGGG